MCLKSIYLYTPSLWSHKNFKGNILFAVLTMEPFPSHRGPKLRYNLFSACHVKFITVSVLQEMFIEGGKKY